MADPRWSVTRAGRNHSVIRSLARVFCMQTCAVAAWSPPALETTRAVMAELISHAHGYETARSESRITHFYPSYFLPVNFCEYRRCTCFSKLVILRQLYRILQYVYVEFYFNFWNINSLKTLRWKKKRKREKEYHIIISTSKMYQFNIVT